LEPEKKSRKPKKKKKRKKPKPLDIRPEYSVSTTSVGWAPEIAPNPLSRQCLVLNYQRTSSDSDNKHGSQILKKLHHHP
jgi:hypothetical protein